MGPADLTRKDRVSWVPFAAGVGAPGPGDGQGGECLAAGWAHCRAGCGWHSLAVLPGGVSDCRRGWQTAAGTAAVPAGHTGLRTQHSHGGRQTPGPRTRSSPAALTEELPTPSHRPASTHEAVAAAGGDKQAALLSLKQGP